ncbi:hypothetical protein CI610_02234 [invertebrate metagenome]|uniref:RING-type domain-containing protein n=1 Tax=invertebrate metagenome TaxID=1711999 RepID=A0A2H9T6H4_9ZZZZ
MPALSFKQLFYFYVSMVLFYSSYTLSITTEISVDGKKIKVEKIEATTCPICLEILSDQVNVVQTNSCGHSFCQTCEAHLVTRKCPVCREGYKDTSILRTLTKANRTDLYKCPECEVFIEKDENDHRIKTHLRSCMFSKGEQQQLIKDETQTATAEYLTTYIKKLTLEKKKKEPLQEVATPPSPKEPTHSKLSESVEVFTSNNNNYRFSVHVSAFENHNPFNTRFASGDVGIKEYTAGLSVGDNFTFLEPNAIKGLNNISVEYHSIVACQETERPSTLSLYLSESSDFFDVGKGLSYYLVYIVELPGQIEKHYGIQEIRERTDVFYIENSTLFQLIDPRSLSHENEQLLDQATQTQIRTTRLNSVKYTFFIALGNDLKWQPTPTITQTGGSLFSGHLREGIRGGCPPKVDSNSNHFRQFVHDGARSSHLFSKHIPTDGVCFTDSNSIKPTPHSGQIARDGITESREPNHSDQPQTHITMKLLSKTKVPEQLRHVPKPFPERNSLFLITDYNSKTCVTVVYLDILDTGNLTEASIKDEISDIQRKTKYDIDNQKEMHL